MRGFIRSKIVLSLLILVLIPVATLVPLSRIVMQSHAMALAGGPPPTWGLPFPPGTSVNIGPLGLHDHNFRSMVDDRTGTVFTFQNQLDPDSLDIVLQPPATGTSTIPATSLANGTVLAVWAACQLVLIDHGNGWWAIYLHLANIQVTSGNTVTAGSILGYPTTNVPTLAACGSVESTAEHVHFAFLKGSGTTGKYVSMLGQVLDGHAVVELNNDPTDIILQGLTTTKGQVFTIPACGVNNGAGKAVFVEAGTSFYALNANDGSVRWCYPVGGDASPAVANGVVYFGSDAVYALNTTDGSLLWRYPTGPSGTAFSSSPAVVNNIVYIGSFDNSVYALNAKNSSLLWRYQTGGQIVSSPAVVNGVLYIGSGDSYVYALEASNGSLLWRYKTGDIVNSSPAVANGEVVIGSLDGYLYTLNASNGSLLWRSQTGDPGDLSPALVGGVVYTNDGGTMYALRGSNGSLLWKSPAPGSGTLFIGLAPKVVGGVVYASGVYAFNASNGSQLWYNQVTYSGGATSEPSVNAGVVYVCSSDGNTYALNASNGSILWKSATGFSYGTPAVA